MSAKVAIVMRTKDRPVFLRRALKSVVEQTFEDWQLAIVNDQGDSSLVEKAVSEYPALAPKIVRVEAPNGLLREGLINSGISATTSELVTVLDDDDTWSENFLERAISKLEDSSDCIGVVTGAQIIFEKFHGDRFKTESSTDISHWMRDLSFWQMLGQNLFPIHSLVYRRAALDETGPYENLSVLGDWEFNIRLMMSGDLAGLPEFVGANYHQRISSDQHSAQNTVTNGASEHDAERRRMIDESPYWSYMKLAAIDRGLELDLAHLENELMAASRIAARVSRKHAADSPIKAISADFPPPANTRLLNEALRHDIRKGVIGEGVIANMIAASLRLEGKMEGLHRMIEPISKLASVPLKVKAALG